MDRFLVGQFGGRSLVHTYTDTHTSTHTNAHAHVYVYLSWTRTADARRSQSREARRISGTTTSRGGSEKISSPTVHSSSSQILQVWWGLGRFGRFLMLHGVVEKQKF